MSKKEKKREKTQFFNCLLQSSGVVKHSPLNSRVALATNLGPVSQMPR